MRLCAAPCFICLLPTPRLQDPALGGVFPQRGPKAGGSSLTIRGQRLRTGHTSEVAVLIGGVPCVV